MGKPIDPTVLKSARDKLSGCTDPECRNNPKNARAQRDGEQLSACGGCIAARRVLKSAGESLP